MNLRRIQIVLLLLAAAALPLAAESNVATAAHLQVQLLTQESAIHPSDPLHAGLYFKLEPGWHIYWKNAGDSGEPPKIDWTLPQGMHADAMEFPAPERLPLGPLMDYGYENEVLFPVLLHSDSTLKPDQTIHLSAKVSWLVCKNVCIPGKATLTLDLPVVSAKPVDNAVAVELFDRLSNRLPKLFPAKDQAIYQATATGFQISLSTGHHETTAVFFPSDQNIIDNPAKQIIIPTDKGFVLELKKDASFTTNPARLNGVIELSGGRAYEIAALPGVVVIPGINWPELFRITGLAFLGGLLLNLMPCVFPVLFLKGLSLVHSGNKERNTLRAHGAVYAAGIVVSFWFLVAVLHGLRAAGATLGWGFQFQSPVFLELMAALLFFLGLSLAGVFEIGLTLTSAGGSLAAKQGYVGSFFTGVLAVVVATPCTAPFMGAAVGYALSQSAAVAFAVFTALALGLAGPYVLLTLHPAWTRLLPKPGAWMDWLKRATSLPIFATALWLAWVLCTAYGRGLLFALLGCFALLVVAGWILGRWPLKRWSSFVAVGILLLVVAVSIVAPSKLNQAGKLNLSTTQRGDAFAERSEAAAVRSTWEPWSQEAVERYRAQGRPVFVDFTASWCLSCQVNERVALDQPQVQEAFKKANVALLKADWTQHDDAITNALAALGRNGVPAYVLYKPGSGEPELLPEVLTPGIVIKAIKK